MKPIKNNKSKILTEDEELQQEETNRIIDRIKRVNSRAMKFIRDNQNKFVD